jgi:CheY-like chemotaxis protein
MTCHQAIVPTEPVTVLSADQAGYDVALLDVPMTAVGDDYLTRVLPTLPGGTELPLILLSPLQWRPDPQHAARFAAVLTKPARSGLLLKELLAVLAPTEAVLDAIEAGDGQRATDTSSVTARSLRVLVAEDNAVNQMVARLMLTKLGHRVDVVKNGLEAVQALRVAPYDVAIMDLQMPVLDGLGATRQIREQIPPASQPFIVALTASVLGEDRQACMDAGMDAFLTKPIRGEDLEHVLARAYPAGAPGTAVRPGTH